MIFSVITQKHCGVANGSFHEFSRFKTVKTWCRFEGDIRLCHFDGGHIVPADRRRPSRDQHGERDSADERDRTTNRRLLR